MCYFSFFFFNDTATTEIYTLSLHDALPICPTSTSTTPLTLTSGRASASVIVTRPPIECPMMTGCSRSEEHTSELQSHLNLVCRLLLEKKKKQTISPM